MQVMVEALEWCVVVWDFAAAPAANQSLNLTTVGVALISGLIGISGSWLALGWQAWRESRSVRAAIMAEVEALIEIAKRQKYGNQISAALRSWTYDQEHRLGGYYRVRLTIPEHYNRVYLANAPKLGVLREKDARNVVRFYQLMDSLRADTSEGGVLFDGTQDYELLRGAQQLYKTVMDLGESLAVR